MEYDRGHAFISIFKFFILLLFIFSQLNDHEETIDERLYNVTDAI